MEATMETAPRTKGKKTTISFSGKSNVTQKHGSNKGYSIGFKKVGCHTGAVTDVVTDVVGDGCRVSWIIFRNPGFDFTHQVSADVSAFGEDTAAQTGQRWKSSCRQNQARPEARPNR